MTQLEIMGANAKNASVFCVRRAVKRRCAFGYCKGSA